MEKQNREKITPPLLFLGGGRGWLNRERFPLNNRYKMKQIWIAVLLLMSTNLMAQSPAYDISKDEKEGGLIFNGTITFNDLAKEPSFTWFKPGVDEYKPDEAMVNYLRTYLGNYTMVVFMGTWCDDSHYLIPKLEKVIQLTNYPASQLTMYGVDREKNTKNGDSKKYNITLVPTIILYKDGTEIGRITETTKKNLETDLSYIISPPQKN